MKEENKNTHFELNNGKYQILLTMNLLFTS